MVRIGDLYVEGVQVGTLCKQNGKWFILDNVDFGFKRPFRYRQEAINAIREWWNN